ncbi:TRAP transporter large permease subunit [Verminephrobacter eiseniae]|nr:TRAP transporter large permease subunit [Verminephrobacter eiseniae]MCW5295782.1 TRAP transporter large permease subunit [Verminephrobacter eiseniae]MCW8187234.1 TRAP transporter large permease subunit [Verminephrobacter eiseniae]MCW8226054.1 TRAP transporter large permease subunit [Verminephrobacter eiseniae]MCW8236540.1 TRAP transporter large permease subunit [Verminephrobacter eiseniae]
MPIGPPDRAGHPRALPWLIVPLEWASAGLMLVIMALLLTAVLSRYLFSSPIVWIDEIVSMSFIWLCMMGTALAMHRNEHLRLGLFVDRLSGAVHATVRAFALCAMLAFLLALLPPACEYAQQEWLIRTPALDLPNTFRVAAIPFGFAAMLLIVLAYAVRTVPANVLLGTAAVVIAVVAALYGARPALAALGNWSMLIFLVGVVLLCLLAGVPIAFCFGLGAIGQLAFTTQVPLLIVVGRMDEGMSSLILVSVPIFVLLGCILDATGMGKAIVEFLGALIGHLKAGMSYVLLGSLFIVSGISGSKVSDMATVAPALFPEMKRRGNKPGEMVALLATGAAMADTVPPSIVLIVLGSVAGVSIAGLFQSGFVVALVLLLSLMALARWKARNERAPHRRRASPKVIGQSLLVAAPALLLPFLIRSAVGGGVATATEVSTIAVLYALLTGQVMYGGIGARRFYAMLVETVALSGAILLILGAASALAWTITYSGIVQQLSPWMTAIPGGQMAFLALTIVLFLVLGCLLEGLPAVLLLAPIMYPMARKLGIHDVHYSMVIVCAMNVGLMMPPIGVGFYIACRIGEVKPDEALRSIWPYLLALLAGVVVIAAVPGISTLALKG